MCAFIMPRDSRVVTMLRNSCSRDTYPDSECVGLQPQCDCGWSPVYHVSPPSWQHPPLSFRIDLKRGVFGLDSGVCVKLLWFVRYCRIVHILIALIPGLMSAQFTSPGWGPINCIRLYILKSDPVPTPCLNHDHDSLGHSPLCVVNLVNPVARCFCVWEIPEALNKTRNDQ